LEAICQLVASLVVFYIPLVQQVANLHAVIDLIRLATQKSCELVGNPGFQLVRLVGCGL